MTKQSCNGTEALSHAEAEKISQERNTYPPAYGRLMCSKCYGIVLPTSSGKLRKHVEGSNVSTIRDYKPRLRRY